MHPDLFWVSDLCSETVSERPNSGILLTVSRKKSNIEVVHTILPEVKKANNKVAPRGNWL